MNAISRHFKYFRVLALVVSFTNVIMLKFRSQKHIANNPELKSGYDTLIWGYSFWGSLPWLVMGLGSFAGNTTIFDYFRPQDGNPYVVACIATIVGNGFFCSIGFS